MNEILLINPRKRRKKKRAVAKRRVKRRATTTQKTYRKRRAVSAASRRKTTRRVLAMPKKRRTTRRRKSYRKNPTVRTYARRAARRAKSSFAGLDFKKAMKNIPLFQIGMFASKFAAKFKSDGATEIDPESWTAIHYLKGSLGSVGAGFLAQMIKPGTGQKIMEGGLNFVVFKILENELIQKNETARNWLGGYDYEGADYLPGDVEQDESGKSYLLGEDYQWRELPESTMEGELYRPGPLGQVVPVTHLGAEDPYAKALLDA